LLLKSGGKFFDQDVHDHVFPSSDGKRRAEKDDPYEAVTGCFFCPGQGGFKHVPEKNLDENRGEHDEEESDSESLLNDIKDSFKNLHPLPCHVHPRTEFRGRERRSAPGGFTLIDGLDFFKHAVFPEVFESLRNLGRPLPERLEVGPDDRHASLLELRNQARFSVEDQFIVELPALPEGIQNNLLILGF